MRTPGFTADVTLGQKSAPYRTVRALNASADTSVLTPQFVGGHFCFWQCYPGSGCEYRCEFFPF
jgi:hypothetical protein